ncbi:MAG: hypothetical protein ABSG03_29350 [Bryobacteraceae bacterium]|jgi:hypothetical protein
MKIAIGCLLCLAGALGLRAQAALALPVHSDLGAAAQSIEDTGLRQLLTLKRVYVDKLTGGETAAQMRDIIIGSLEQSKLFILTENQEKADAVLHGAAEDLVYTETHSSSDGVNAKLNVGSSHGASGYRADQSGGLGIGENESDHSAMRRHEALATVRLTNKDGDVIWSTTQESLGAKYHGASADVADKIAAKLREDFERAKRIAH